MSGRLHVAAILAAGLAGAACASDGSDLATPSTEAAAPSTEAATPSTDAPETTSSISTSTAAPSTITAPVTTTTEADLGCTTEPYEFAVAVPVAPSAEMTAAVQAAAAQPPVDPATIDPAALPAVLAEERANFDRTGDLLPPAPGVTITPVDAGGVPASWIATPEVDDDRVVVYVHGGGFVVGSVASHGGLASRISEAARARVLFVQPRLAPEHPFPAAIDDVVTAYRWLIAEGADPSCVVIAGDSAGGGGALSATIRLRDEGDPLPAGVAMLSPVTDQTASGASRAANAATDPLVGGAVGALLTALYLQSADPASPAASPLFADLSGLPALATWVSTSEVLLDDSRRLAEAARAAGVDTFEREFPGALHVWPQAVPTAPESAQTVSEVGGWIASRTVRPATS